MDDTAVKREVPEDFQPLVNWAKAMKDSRTDLSPPEEGAPDITPHVAFYRGEKLVATGYTMNVDRDEGLDLAWVGSGVFSADRLEVVLDAHQADEKFFDKYGRLPDPGELETLCETEGACEIGLITDCIVAARATKEGICVITLPYHIDVRKEELDPRAARRIVGDERDRIKREANTYTRVLKSCHWQEDRLGFLMEDEKSATTGVVPDALRACLERSDVLADMMTAGGPLDPEIFGLAPERARLHADIAGVTVLAGLGFAVALSAETEEDAAIIERSLARQSTLKAYSFSKGDAEGRELSHELIDDPDELIGAVLNEAVTQDTRLQMEARRKKAKQDAEAETARRRSERAKAGGLSTEDLERVKASYLRAGKNIPKP